MTEEAFRKAIRFKTIDEPGHYLRHFEASVGFSYKMSASIQPGALGAEIERRAKDCAVEALLRHVYEDRRKELYDAIYDLHQVNPMNINGYQQQVDKILQLAKRQ